MSRRRNQAYGVSMQYERIGGLTLGMGTVRNFANKYPPGVREKYAQTGKCNWCERKATRVFNSQESCEAHKANIKFIGAEGRE